jgi:hypothetical protein
MSYNFETLGNELGSAIVNLEAIKRLYGASTLLNRLGITGIGETLPEVNAPNTQNVPFSMEAVVVCDHYSDFLVHTLPHTKFLFDKIVVVTSYEDKETQRVCEFHHVMCIKTDELMSRKGEFHKGKGINEGLQQLSMKGWVVHMDADIYLPPQTRILIERAKLDPTFIYGIDRFIVKGYKEWATFTAMPKLQQEAETYIHLNNSFPLGTRVMHGFAGGWLPIGYFQMFNPLVTGIKTYPDAHTNAGRGDTLFAEQWPRSKRALIPEIVGYHLESINSSMAANWNGRTTLPFLPE